MIHYNHLCVNFSLNKNILYILNLLIISQTLTFQIKKGHKNITQKVINIKMPLWDLQWRVQETFHERDGVFLWIVREVMLLRIPLLMEQKVWLLITSFATSFSFFFPSKKGKRKGEWSSKIVIKSHTFLFHPRYCVACQ